MNAIMYCPKCGNIMNYHMSYNCGCPYSYYTCTCGYDSRSIKTVWTTTTKRCENVYYNNIRLEYSNGTTMD